MRQFITLVTLISTLLLHGCGSSSSSESDTQTIIEDESVSSSTTLSIDGKATYDYVPASDNGLDFAHTQAKPIRYATVLLLDQSDTIVAQTHTDAEGYYRFDSIAPNSNVKVRIVASLEQQTPKWDFKVVDNTDGNATYAIEGELATISESSQTRNLHAASGWSIEENAYTSIRAAAPFAILDDIYQVVSLIQSADDSIDFAPLQANWSSLNKALFGDIEEGEIITTYYQNGNLYILGDAEDDTDEYDSHVITHELGHYYEDLFSRSDSIGGSHGIGDLLDIRVAFGEGWGNAFSAMSLSDPLYCDTYFSNSESYGWGFDIENGDQENPGWFSEGSIQRILYDLWDSQNDTQNNDTLSLGFSPIHTVMTTTQKQTEAFTSLFSFIDALKKALPQESEAIDNIVSNESIATIDDIYGTNRQNHEEDYPYHSLTIDSDISITIDTDNGFYNKLGNRQLILMRIEEDGEYTISLKQTNDDNADPMFMLYTASPHQLLTMVDQRYDDEEQTTMRLEKGSYLIDVSNLNSNRYATFTLSLTSE